MKNSPLIDLTLYLADSSLIMGHRLSEWASHGPTLEQDIAISNIALDLIGQSRNFYQYAASLIGEGATEDTLAYHRDEKDFKNLLITELPNVDWAYTITKVFFFSTFQSLFYQHLKTHKDKQLAAIAEKSIKEVTYHVKWSSDWVMRLGDGTEESHNKMLAAIDAIYNYVMEMFWPEDFEMETLEKADALMFKIGRAWHDKVYYLFEGLNLHSSSREPKNQSGGKRGEHTEHLKLILNEMQELQRTLPGLEW